MNPWSLHANITCKCVQLVNKIGSIDDHQKNQGSNKWKRTDGTGKLWKEKVIFTVSNKHYVNYFTIILTLSLKGVIYVTKEMVKHKNISITNYLLYEIQLHVPDNYQNK